MFFAVVLQSVLNLLLYGLERICVLQQLLVGQFDAWVLGAQFRIQRTPTGKIRLTILLSHLRRIHSKDDRDELDIANSIISGLGRAWVILRTQHVLIGIVGERAKCLRVGEVLVEVLNCKVYLKGRVIFR